MTADEQKELLAAFLAHWALGKRYILIGRVFLPLGPFLAQSLRLLKRVCNPYRLFEPLVYLIYQQI